MRIVAGKYGGRRIAAPASDGTRPTGERVREAIFSVLGPLDGVRVLDLFAGSGALGIEALSRGAASAVFVDRGRRQQLVLEQNLELLGVTTATVVRDEAERFLGRRAAGLDPFALIFVDPPYAQAEQLVGSLAPQIATALQPAGRVVFEARKGSELKYAEAGLEQVFQRRYGDTTIEIAERVR